MERIFHNKNQMGILKTIGDNYSRQLVTIRGILIFPTDLTDKHGYEKIKSLSFVFAQKNAAAALVSKTKRIINCLSCLS